MKLKRSGLTACAFYLVAILWLIAKRCSGAQSSALDAAEFYLVTYPLGFLGINSFGTEAFWAKYELMFFPFCFMTYYLVGCGVGWVMGYDRQSDDAESAHPPDKG